MEVFMTEPKKLEKTMNLSFIIEGIEERTLPEALIHLTKNGLTKENREFVESIVMTSSQISIEQARNADNPDEPPF
jgi:hypothetical protein